jgi:hypothetical protein
MERVLFDVSYIKISYCYENCWGRGEEEGFQTK